MSRADEVVVEPRNAETGQNPLQVAVDSDTGRWYRCELRDGRVVFLNESRRSFPWVGHQPPLSLRWEPVEPARAEAS